MPTRLLSVPHRPQIEDAGCLGACAQMIMNYLGLDYSQATLNGVLGLTSIGTPYRNIQRLSQLGVRVAMQIGVDTDIQFAIDHEMPPIVFLMTGALPYWSDDASHSVVVVGYNEQCVFLNDPVFDEAPMQASWDAFMLAWSEQDYTFAIVTA